MAQSLGSYSRMIAWLKIILPLTALGLLATLFLFARGIDPELSIPLANVDVKELAREPRITAPEFSGMTADGAAIQISASHAKKPSLPQSDDVVADRLTALIQTPDGEEVLAQADSGAIENASIARFTGNVLITSSSGYRVSTDEMTADLDRTLIQSHGAVTANGPIGELEAGKMVIELRNSSRSSILVFKDRIRVLYDPNEQKGAEP